MNSNTLSTVPIQPAGTLASLWSAGKVSAISLLIGFPAGLFLACLNWRHMGQGRKVNTHIAAVLLVAMILGSLQQSSAAPLGFLLSLVFSLGFAFYLYRVMDSDIATFRVNNNYVDDEGWLSGIVVGIVGRLCYAALAVLIGLWGNFIAFLEHGPL